MGERRKRFLFALTLGYILLSLLPLAGALGTGVGITTLTEGLLLSSRRLMLLKNSLCLGIAVSAICVFLGFYGAAFIRNSFLAEKWYRYYFVLLLPIPFYIYALCWMYGIRALSRSVPSFLQYSMQGFAVCVFVEVLAFYPIALLFILIGMEGLDGDILRAAAVFCDGGKVLHRIVLPSCMPNILAAGSCILLLSMTDFSVPSMFQYNTYTLDIFSAYSRNGNAAEAYIRSVPMFLLLMLPLSRVINGIRKQGILGNQKNVFRLRLHGISAMLSKAAFLLSGLQVLIPICILAATCGGISVLKEAAGLLVREMAASAETAFLAAVLAVALSLAPSLYMEKQKAFSRWLLILYPVAVPGVIQAIGLLHVLNGSAFYKLSYTVFPAAIGCAFKLLPLLVMWMSMCRRIMDRKPLELGWLYAVNYRKGIMLEYRMLLPAICGAFVLSFFLAFGEEGIYLMLMAPGRETVSVKIYNYLHYGASEYVSAFCLWVLLFLLLVEAAAVIIWRRQTRGRREKK